MNRRNALKSGLVLATASSIFTKTKAFEKISETSIIESINEDYTCLVKKGHPRNDAVFCYSVMSVKSYTRVKSDIDELFLTNRYNTELKYVSNDRYKIEIANAVINYMKSTTDITFDIVIYRSNPVSYVGMQPKAYEELTMNLYGNLNLGFVKSSNIVMKAEDKFGPSQKLQSDFSKDYAMATNFIVANSDRLIQVNDFIAGCILAIKSNKKIESSTKNLLNTSFQSIFVLNPSLENEIKDIFTIRIVDV